MLDLFGHQITAPKCAGLENAKVNKAEGFAEFWAAWPKSNRKVGKQQCLDKWARHGCFENWRHIVAHVEYMTTQPDWIKDSGSFIPMPATYLNQQRWVDWEPVVKKAAPAPVKQAADNPAPMPESARALLANLRRKAA